MKSSSTGIYLWRPGLNGLSYGDPNTISGFPYVINNHMAKPAGGAIVILFGNLGYYLIRDVAFNIRARFFDSTTGGKLQTRYIQWKRNYGRYVGAIPGSAGDKTEAVKYLQIKA